MRTQTFDNGMCGPEKRVGIVRVTISKSLVNNHFILKYLKAGEIEFPLPVDFVGHLFGRILKNDSD